MNQLLPLAALLDGGWFHIGPPSLYITSDPVIVHLGPFAVRWYGLFFVVAVLVGVRVFTRYATRKGISGRLLSHLL